MMTKNSCENNGNNSLKHFVSKIKFFFAFLLLQTTINFLIKYYLKDPILFLIQNESTYIDPGTHKELRCMSNGWPENGSKEFWKFYYYPEYPTLQDIFEDNGFLVVILSTFLIRTHPSNTQRMKKYHSSKWCLYFHKNNETQNINQVINPKNPIIAKPETDHKTFIIKLRFNIPLEYQNKYNFATIQIMLDEMEDQNKENRLMYRPLSINEPLFNPKFYEAENEIQGGYMRTKIFMRMPNSTKNKDDLSYRNVPFCQIKDKYSIYVNPISNKEEGRENKNIYLSANGQVKDFLRICTENVIFDNISKNDVLFRWIIYNIDQGFKKPIIYINKIDTLEDKAFSYFKKFIDLDLIEMIYYVFPYSFFFHDQLAQEVSCTERNKGRTVWLGHDDADERFYFYDELNSSNNITFEDVMREYTTEDNIKNIGGLRCNNMWMERLKNDTTYRDSYKSSSECTKDIIIPENVDFYYIHSISSGKRELRPKNIVNAHFKPVTDSRVRFNDKILSPRMTKINERISRKIQKLIEY